MYLSIEFADDESTQKELKRMRAFLLNRISGNEGANPNCYKTMRPLIEWISINPRTPFKVLQVDHFLAPGHAALLFLARQHLLKDFFKIPERQSFNLQ
jgi:hypothetical protein